MSDIAKWLRDNAPADHGLVSGDLMREAAAEIERLQVEIAQGNAAWKEAHIGCEIEIERLKAALREIANARRVTFATQEIARAALEGDEAKKICPECGQPMREGGYCDHVPF